MAKPNFKQSTARNSKMKIRKGDKVLVITGKDRNKVGTVERVVPTSNRAVVSGINMVKKSLKRSAKNPQGGIIDKALPIHISNLMILDPSKNKPTRVGYKIAGKEKQRVAKLSGESIKEIK